MRPIGVVEVTSFSWGPEGVPVQDRVGTARVLDAPVATQWSAQLTMQHVYDLIATCQRRKMQWRDAAVVQQQRVVQGDIEYRFVVLVQDDDE
jgi:hypothetical protein